MAKFEAPKGLPTVFDPSFKGVGQKEGLEIWRVEKLAIVKKPPTDDCYKGAFFTGDSYIILHTKLRQSALERHIFFWLGKETSQDEQGVAAYKTVELDQSLGGEPVQHREVQEGESDEFLGLFKQGVSYMAGGIATGFKTVDRSHTVRLLHVKGRRNIRITEVPVNPASMNTGDVFILDGGDEIFQWNGPLASQVEKKKALAKCLAIKDNERGGKAKLFLIDEGQGDAEAEAKFWTKLGCKKCTIRSPGHDDDDDKYATDILEKTKLYHISDSTGALKVEEVKQKPFKKEMLNTGDAYLLDAAGTALYAWIGKGASEQEKLHAMKYATDFLKQKGYPLKTPITRCTEGAESAQFKDNFEDWPEKHASSGLMRSPEKKKFEKKSFDVSSLHQAAKREEASMPDDGSGKVQVWRIENFELSEYPKDLYGQFFGGDSYVILYTYLVNSKENYIIYFWQGLKSSQDEKGASALHTKNLDDSLGGAAVQVRVVQNKEPPHFYRIFQGKMVVHSGGRASGFKNKADVDSYDTDGTCLYQIRGSSTLNTRAVQVPEIAASLNSGDSFILETPSKVYLWAGNGSSGDEREFAKSISKVVSRKEYELIQEGKEPQHFWDSIGGKTEYASSKATLDIREPRLFQCTNAVGYFRIEEVYDFDQEDLIEDDVMILDTYFEVFIWTGSGANAEEKKKSLESALEFVRHDKSGRTIDDTVFISIKQGFEPPNFTCHFHGWDATKWSNGKTYAQLKAQLGGKDLTSSAASELSKYTGGKTYSYETLIGSVLPDGVDPLHKELSLGDADFEKYLGMKKVDFAKLPQWKAAQIKKKVKLY